MILGKSKINLKTIKIQAEILMLYRVTKQNFKIVIKKEGKFGDQKKKLKT